MMRLSGVFENMIESSEQDDNEEEEGCIITINGVDPSVFKKIIK
jgi:hypothetical protein